MYQTDGDLVLYRNSDGAPFWASHTWGQPGNRLVMQTDGNAVIYNTGGGAVWATGTHQ